MGAAFWIRRFLTVFAGAFAIIAVAQLLKGRTAESATLHGLGWAAVTAAVFTTSRIYQSRRQQHCAICRDTPEKQSELSWPGRASSPDYRPGNGEE